MAKKFYIREGEYKNVYEVGWLNENDLKMIGIAIELGYREISYDEAIFKCKEQREMIQNCSIFSGYGSSNIYPLGISNISPIDQNKLKSYDGFVFE